VLSGAPDALLDTYQEEREPHVRFITGKAIELGRVQTMRDPDAARERDARMIAARQANKRPDKLVYPALAGRLIANDGGLFPQGLVSTPDRTALFDDVAGPGWLVVGRNADALVGLDQGSVQRLGARTLHFGLGQTVGGAQVFDTNGLYGRWFARTGAIAVILRPDGQIHGRAETAPDLSALLARLLAALGLD
jgi:hypothetical protein